MQQAGLSPNDIPQTEEELWITLEKIEKMAKENKKVVAIGEIGLDYYWEKRRKNEKASKKSIYRTNKNSK